MSDSQRRSAPSSWAPQKASTYHTGTPAFSSSAGTSSLWHISSARIAHLRLKTHERHEGRSDGPCDLTVRLALRVGGTRGGSGSPVRAMHRNRFRPKARISPCGSGRAGPLPLSTVHCHCPPPLSTEFARSDAAPALPRPPLPPPQPGPGPYQWTVTAIRCDAGVGRGNAAKEGKKQYPIFCRR